MHRVILMWNRPVRLKNTLAVVQAIGSQTPVRTASEAVATFGRRLTALSSAHDVLLQQS